MRYRYFVPLSFLVLFGGGCFNNNAAYVEADITPATIGPQEESIEGAQASRGGYEATITQKLDSQILANALPDDNVFSTYKAQTPVEEQHPVPDLEGKRTEYTTLKKTYQKTSGTTANIISVAITDTRGLPVLTAFIRSYTEYDTERSYRKRISNIDQFNGWMNYNFPMNAETGGFGSIMGLYRDRFLVQIDGNAGVTEEELQNMLEGVHFDYLK